MKQFSHEDFEDGLDEPDLPRCQHCKGSVCTYDGCTADNDCPHGGQGILTVNGWVCASQACQKASVYSIEWRIL